MFKLTKGSNYPKIKIGNKGWGLQTLLNNGILIPDTWVISADGLDNLSDDLFNNLENWTYIVRSSGVISMPGVLESVLDVKKDGLLSAVHQVKNSWNTSLATKYRKFKNMDNAINMAIIIQKQIQPDFSGVANSIDPTTGENKICGQYVKGMLDKYCLGGVDGEDFENLNYKIGLQVEQLVRSGENMLSYPAEVEWASENGQVFAVQLRKASLTNIAFFQHVKRIIDWSDSIIKEKYWLEVEKVFGQFNIDDCVKFIPKTINSKKICDGKSIVPYLVDGEVSYDTISTDYIYAGEIRIENLNELCKAKGVIVRQGGLYSHIADQLRANQTPSTYAPKFDGVGHITITGNGEIYEGEVTGKIKNIFDEKTIKKIKDIFDCFNKNKD